MHSTLPVIVGISGASGSVMARATVERLLALDVPVIVTASAAARLVWRDEMDESFGAALERWTDSGPFTYHPVGELNAPIASGTFGVRGMAVTPCSMATAAAIAGGMADNLLRRAADVCLKEKRPLIVVPRETPLNAVHLDNLAALARLGATVLPPHPPFYLKPATLEETVSFTVERTLVALGISDRMPDHMTYRGPYDAD